MELQIPAAALLELAGDPDSLGGWGPVITDLAHQYTSEQQPPDGDPTRRFPDAALRRYVQTRDRYCIGIGCRAPARGTDTDHTLDHARAGATTGPNLGSACQHDHLLKHEGGWRLEQPEPGYFRWTSRTGHTYLVAPSPIIEPLPDPIPRHGPAPPLIVPVDHAWEESEAWEDRSSEGDTGPPPGPSPPHDPNEDPPPF